MGRERSSIVWGSVLVGLIALSAILAPWIASEPNRVDLGSVLSPPNSSHWLGTDGLGRDVAARMVHGARISLLVGIMTGILSVLIGLPVGAIGGYTGGTADAAVSRLIEATLYGPYNEEEKRLIRQAFRQLSGGIDWQFYIQRLSFCGLPHPATT